MSALRTPTDWCMTLGVRILDPDGWRGAGGRPWKDPITEDEFRDRLRVCTIDVRAAEYLETASGGAA